MKTTIIKGEWEKRTERNINKIKKAVQELKNDGLEVYIDKKVETLVGSQVDNVYVRDKLGNGKVIYQKHLFTV